MPIKFLSTLKKTAYKTVKIAGITLVMLMMAYGIDLTNDAAVSLAADFYYIDANVDPNQSFVKGLVTDYNLRPQVWVNDGGLLKAKVWDFEDRNRNNILQEDSGMCIRYARNAFVRDGNIQNGDHIYYCGDNCGRVSGLGTLHNKYILMCPDWNNDYGHIMEKGEVYNGVTIQTTGRLFFGRDAELTQDCLNQLAAVGVNINAPTQLTGRLYVRDSAYALYRKSEAEWNVPEDYYAVDDDRGCKFLTHYDHDYPYAISAYADDNVDKDTIDTQIIRQWGIDANTGVWESLNWAEEEYRGDDADWLRYDWDSHQGFEQYMDQYPSSREHKHWQYNISRIGHTHK
jgi:hypothetical protein